MKGEDVAIGGLFAMLAAFLLGVYILTATAETNRHTEAMRRIELGCERGRQ